MTPNLGNSNAYARNLQKNQLGGVIFGCTSITMKECLFKQLFGLPAQHFSYVKNIDPGLPVFLFNYSDHKLHGIFEAASSGQLNINPYAWTADGAERTQYPAQVQIRVRMQCQPLIEGQFKPIIVDNYYNRNHFWFELDHAQTGKLLALLTSSAVASSTSVPQNTAKWRTIFHDHLLPETRERAERLTQLPLEIENFNTSTMKLDSISVALSSDGDNKPLVAHLDAELVKQDEKDLIFKKLEELACSCRPQEISLGVIEDTPVINLDEKGFTEKQMGSKKNEESPCTSLKCQSIISQLVQGMEELKAFKTEQTLKMVYLEQKLVKAEEQIRLLKDRCLMLESRSNPSMECIDENMNSFDELNLDHTDSIHLVGGYDGESWLSALDLYFPTQDVIKSLSPMSTARSYASVALLNGELYVFGGGNGHLWYDTVESYNQANNEWTLRPSLTAKKGSLAGATLNDKIFAIGGGNGVECFSDVEMLDLDVGRWIPTRSMLQKRFALSAVELNGVLYTTGGYDGNDYLKSAERFDPREHSWARIASMNTKRGCHSLVVLNEKLYALGGFDGSTMVSSTEIFDPRMGSWISSDPMKKSRGYSAAAVVKESIYVVGGLKSGENIVDTAEHFKEGQGWQEKKTRAVRKRCFMSAIVL